MRQWAIICEVLSGIWLIAYLATLSSWRWGERDKVIGVLFLIGSGALIFLAVLLWAWTIVFTH